MILYFILPGTLKKRDITGGVGWGVGWGVRGLVWLRARGYSLHLSVCVLVGVLLYSQDMFERGGKAKDTLAPI